MEPMGFEFATGEQARLGSLYQPEADRDLSLIHSKHSLPAPLFKIFHVLLLKHSLDIAQYAREQIL